jgi:tRNA (guanine-N7-)-methyltransferase
MIKSYVLRKGRTTKLQQRALDELYPLYGIPFNGRPIDRKELFAGVRPLILEIGFGMGEATIALAERCREYNFIGIEVYPPGVGKVLDEIHRRELNNLRVIRHDAVEVVREMIPRESLEGIHLFFPDPWPKKKHHKRRILQTPFAAELAERLKTGAYFYAVSDWEDYAEHILHTLESIDTLENAYGGYAEPQQWRPKTSFETKGMKKAHVIREFLFLRK